MDAELSPKNIGGLSVKTLLIPTAVIVAILHVLIILTILSSDKANIQHSSTLQETGQYTQELNDYMGNVSRVCETASSFVMMPVTGAGDVNAGPLFTYAEALDSVQARDQLLERFRSYGVNPAAVAGLEEAVFGSQKWAVNQSLGAAVSILQEDTAQFSAAISARISRLRFILGGTTLLTFGILFVAFICLYSQMMQPLRRMSRLIRSNSPLDERTGLREVRMVASSYNDVRRRRDRLDSILRAAAETDALTNLPNRYRFEQFIMESDESGYSAAVLLFDVNYLKIVNDTKGHLAGDALLRSAADCIGSCFGCNCFRFGGDEFVAVLKNCALKDVEEMETRFEQAQRERHISIACGCAYTAEIGSTSFNALLSEADKRMYERKKEIHSRDGAAVRTRTVPIQA